MAYCEAFDILNQHLCVDEFTTRALTHTVLGYMRHVNAQLLCDAYDQDKLTLKHVRRYMVNNADIINTLAPSVCASTVYGDENASMCIIRTRISVGERIRLRALKR